MLLLAGGIGITPFLSVLRELECRRSDSRGTPAVTLVWSSRNSAAFFDAVGAPLDGVGSAVLAGYDAAFGLSAEERTALPVLAKGACIRFLLTRAWDWLNTPADALVTRKDPLAYLRRLDWYDAHPEAFA